MGWGRVCDEFISRHPCVNNIARGISESLQTSENINEEGTKFHLLMRATVLSSFNIGRLLGRSSQLAVRIASKTVRQATYKPVTSTGLSEVSGSSRMVMSGMGRLEQLPPAPVLQRDLFCETLQLKALRIPKKECNTFRKLLSG